MSVKRQATTELNHDNWDQDDPADHEEVGSFKIASKDILEKRVIRTAKRRSQATGDEPTKSVFSGFGGFNKTQPASFDFLSKLTNGNNENSNSTSKADSSMTSNLFTSKPLSTSPGTGLFSLQTNTTTPTKSPFGSPSTITGGSSLFGVSSSNATNASNMFTMSKADSTVGDSPFKLQVVTSSTDNTTSPIKSTTTSASTKVNIPNTSNTLLPSTPNSSPFGIQPVTNTVQSNFGMITKSESNSTKSENNLDDIKNESKMKYYSKLKGLNESVSDWIKKHVEQTPLCILTPIFKDYEKYLKEIEDEYQESDKKGNKKTDVKTTTETKSDFGGFNTKPAGAATNSNSTTGSSLFGVSPNSKSLFAPQNNTPAKEPATFPFGINPPSGTSSITKTSTSGFTFGVAATSNETSTTGSSFATGTISSSPFSFATNTSTTTAPNGSAAPFSFGIGKTFSFNSSNIKQNTNETSEEANKEDEDTPPKVDFTPIVEKDSVYDKKCKIFVKKDGNFVDKGVGTLYIKKVEESDKHQLLVRANTNLGTILVNLILMSGIPTQRMGKNNVMMVCIPTPDAKPPPTPILIRVKTSEEADELLATLDKYKT